ncbi:hypothetical protein GH733_002682 [Mirounga leonina]|nr:hypothetical protein GH733_002682 [Mirounga leonina]
MSPQLPVRALLGKDSRILKMQTISLKCTCPGGSLAAAWERASRDLAVTVPEGKVVVLNFRFIDLESDNLCRYDFVDVYSGHANGQRIGRFCGTFRPGALVSSGNKMMVQMISDANTAGNGFMAMFSAAEPNERGDQYCGGRLERPSGSFKTPNWPDRDYPAGVTCVWHIVAPKNQLIELKFEKFDVERDNYCRYDFVAVFNGGEVNDAKRIGKYCGDSPPAAFVKNEMEVPPFLSPGDQPAEMIPQAESSQVLAGTVITTVTRGGSLHATVSIINIYKEGNLAIQQAGKNMSAKVTVVCKQCPLLRRGEAGNVRGETELHGLTTMPAAQP